MMKHLVSIHIEEGKPSKPHTRNPKLYDGQCLSLVRRPDGSLKFFFKELKPETNLHLYADQVYYEIEEAIENIH